MTQQATAPQPVLKIEVILLDNGEIALGIPKPAANAFDRAIYIGMLQQALLGACQMAIAASPIVLARGTLPPSTPNGGK